MNIIVCIKQVPASQKVDIDPINGTLKRAGTETKLNPYDLFAIETAVKLKEEYGGMLTAVTMGPPQAETALLEACYLGCDRGVIITDRAFGGADVLATSYTLAEAIRTIGIPDIIITGKQTTDGDTAQVGAEMSEWLSFPYFGNVRKITRIDNGKITASCSVDSLIYEYEATLPVLISIDAETCTPRLPSFSRKKNQSFEIKKLTLEDLKDHDKNHYGLEGSPTQVQRIFPPSSDKERKIIEGSSRECSDALYSVLLSGKFIQEQ